jgi:hypothetical protein
MTLRSFVCLTILVLVRGGGDAVAQKAAIDGTQIDGDVYGNIYVLDAGKNTLRLYDRDGVQRREIGGTGWENDQFDRPAGVCARNGMDVFVADFGNHRIQRFDRTLTFVSSLSTRNSPNAEERFGYPSDVTLSRSGELFICDTENSRIIKVDALNRVERSFGGFGGGKGRLTAPLRVDAGPGDAIYVLDRERVAVFDPFGNYLHDLLPAILGHPTALYADDETIVVADEGTLYFFDAAERPAGAIPIATIAPGAGELLGMVLQRGTLHLLTGGGLRTVEDPRKKDGEREP